MSAAAIVLVAVVVVMLLTAAATAVRSVSRIWLRHWVEQGGAGRDAALVYLERPQRLLLAAGTAVALTAAVAGLLLGALPASSIWWRIGRVVGAAIALLVVGQLLPRAIARRWAVRLVPVVVPVLRAVDLVLGPLAAATRAAAGRRTAGAAPAESRDALEDLLREGAFEGVSAGDEAAIISGVVQFGDKTARDIMRPRADIFAVDATLPRDVLMEQVAQAGYSRVPVHAGSLDQLVGMVHVFDLIKSSAGRPLAWRPLAFTTPETHCNELLARMLRAQRHLAIVRGADGMTLGLVTLEDLLEELVGDIRDEHDEPAPLSAPAPAPPAPRDAPSADLST